jgi:hypothetical protein
MALNIKSEEAHELAAELAKLTGRSMTAVVVDALRAQVNQHRRNQAKVARVQELMEIGRRCAAHLQQHPAATQHGDLLYDELGMPR